MLISAYLVPHGNQIIPGLEQPYAEGFRPLHQAMEQARDRLAADGADLLILLTPHGIALPEAYGVYLNERLQGLYYDLSESNVFGQVRGRALWPGDRTVAEGLVAALQGAGLPAAGLLQGAPSFPIALTWGELVPLHYLGSSGSPRVVVVSLPRTRANLLKIEDQLFTLGRTLRDFASRTEQRASLVISADLAHTHTAEGPYGVHASAPAYDHLAQEWAWAPTRERLAGLLELQPTALACGMAGMCALQPVLEAEGLVCSGVTYAVPTYFGMMVARWGSSPSQTIVL